ncbi:hypothetical protein CU633_10070 [Bacillus sp. V3-13]|uniref:hypothetical protein n=1 Tax=Bacillus sp. V3-13 TaxID=2053728 RepID=UPI000C77A130|nr:hypothetical protein CU633_10070 [Bacillus sp. V3-13]
MKIINSIAIIYAENNRYSESLAEYSKILSHKKFLFEEPKFLLKIHYNVSKLYFLIKEFECSLLHAKEGISLSLRMEDMSVLGQLFFQQGQCLEVLNKPVDVIIRSYKHSYNIFQLLKRENYITMVKTQKGKYLMN